MEEVGLKNFEDLYVINTKGEVRRRETNTVLRYRWNKGRPFVRVSKDGKRKDIFIVPTLAEQFIPNPHGYKNTALKNKTAPITVENIEWVKSNKFKKAATGKIIKGFKVIEDLGMQGPRHIVKIQCTGCDKEYKKDIIDLKKRKNKFCGCIPDIKKLNNKYLKKQGNKKYVVGLTKDNDLKVKCKYCGEETETTLSNYYSIHNSCNRCYLDGINKEKSISTHPLYTKYSGMLARCSNKNLIAYKYYGGKGIKVCDEWSNSFDNFYKWALDSGWEYGLTIERKDNSKNYSPENCIWATTKEQNRNKSNVKLSLEDAKNIRESNKSIKELADIYKVAPITIKKVLKFKTWS